MTGLETILAAHALKPYDPACSCGWDWDSSKCILPSAVDFDSSRYRLSDTVRPEQHRAHVADQIRGWLLSDEVIEQASRTRWPTFDEASADAQDEMRRINRAAITAALDTTGDS